MLADIEQLIARYAPYSEQREELLVALYGRSETLKIDGVGCQDRALGQRLTEIPSESEEAIGIWIKGMQDMSCRGYAQKLPVTVEKTEDGLACIRAADDEAEKPCFWIAADKVE